MSAQCSEWAVLWSNIYMYTYPYTEEWEKKSGYRNTATEYYTNLNHGSNKQIPFLFEVENKLDETQQTNIHRTQNTLDSGIDYFNMGKQRERTKNIVQGLWSCVSAQQKHINYMEREKETERVREREKGVRRRKRSLG